jgi:hypothetical protein
MQLSHGVLVLVPTRELAREHFDGLPGLCHRTSVFTDAVFGNRSEVLVIKPKHRGDVLVTCAGKLEYLMKMGLLDLSELQTLILDEPSEIFGHRCQIEQLQNCLISGRRVAYYLRIHGQYVRRAFLELGSTNTWSRVQAQIIPARQRNQGGPLYHTIEIANIDQLDGKDHMPEGLRGNDYIANSKPRFLRDRRGQ